MLTATDCRRRRMCGGHAGRLTARTHATVAICRQICPCTLGVHALSLSVAPRYLAKAVLGGAPMIIRGLCIQEGTEGRRAHRARLRQSVVVNLCLDTATARLLCVEQLVCEVQLTLRAFVAVEVVPARAWMCVCARVWICRCGRL